jgi:hypothetical protein
LTLSFCPTAKVASFLGDSLEDTRRQRKRKLKGVKAFGDPKTYEWGGVCKWRGVILIGSKIFSLSKLCNKHLNVFLTKLRKCSKIHETNHCNGWSSKATIKMKAQEKKDIHGMKEKELEKKMKN